MSLLNTAVFGVVVASVFSAVPAFGSEESVGFILEENQWHQAYFQCDLAHSSNHVFNPAPYTGHDFTLNRPSPENLNFNQKNKESANMDFVVQGADNGPGCGMGRCYIDFKLGSTVYRPEIWSPDVLLGSSIASGSLTEKPAEGEPTRERCRSQSQTLFTCTTTNRTITVWKDPETQELKYSSFDFGNTTETPNLEIGGGTSQNYKGRSLFYTFINDGYKYSLDHTIQTNEHWDPSAILSVFKDGNNVLRESCVAYSFSRTSRD